MDKQLQKQLNLLKRVKPDSDWKSSAKEDILGGSETERFYLQALSPQFSFGSLALVGALLFFIVTGFAGTTPEFTATQNRINVRVGLLVGEMQEAEESKEDFFAALGEAERDAVAMIAQVNLDNLSEKEQIDLVRENIDNLLAEVKRLEEDALRIMASADYR